MIDVKAMQTRLAVAADGLMGRNTLRALFARLGAPPARASELALSANVHFRAHGLLDSADRLTHFLAQVCHESGGFRYMEEIASGKAYEGRKDLGNLVQGDGPLFKGRGPLQLTGRANYRRVGQAIGVDLENHPEIAALPSIGLWIACIYWTDHRLNDLCDADDCEAVTRKVNGGLNGFADRKAWLAKVRAIVGTGK